MLRSTRVTRTEPTDEPISVAELRRHLREDSKEHDEQLRSLITVARKTIEEVYLWRALIDQTVIEYFDGFADGMELRWSPIDSITSITYLDTNGSEQTLASSVYEAGSENGWGIVRLKYSQTFPSTRSHADVVWIEYTAGYGTSSDDVPEGIRHAILLYAGGLHDGDPPLPAIDALLAPYTMQRVFSWQ